jgi:menaquinol-cytochrome c reductase iron-sulfur subunit
MINRRTFLARTVQLFTAIIGAVFALPVFRFMRATFTTSNAETSYPVGTTNALQDEVTRVQFTRLVRDGWMVRTVEEYVWIRKKQDGSVVVFEPHCTHLGCAYDWNAKTGQFDCPCHGGKFDAEGNRIAGPPPRPLDQFEVKVEGTQIRIGKILKA